MRPGRARPGDAYGAVLMGRRAVIASFNEAGARAPRRYRLMQIGQFAPDR